MITLVDDQLVDGNDTLAVISGGSYNDTDLIKVYLVGDPYKTPFCLLEARCIVKSSVYEN